MARRKPDGLDVLLREWGALTRLEQEGRPVEWPGHQLPFVLAIMKISPSLRRVLETRYSQPDLSAFNRTAAAELCHTRYHAALAAGRAYVEGFLCAGQERDRATG
jgi:hypothetical protein